MVGAWLQIHGLVRHGADRVGGRPDVPARSDRGAAAVGAE